MFLLAFFSNSYFLVNENVFFSRESAVPVVLDWKKKSFLLFFLLLYRKCFVFMHVPSTLHSSVNILPSWSRLLSSLGEGLVCSRISMPVFLHFTYFVSPFFFGLD